MKVIGISGQKGGTGKTTLTVNLAAWFHEQGFATSILDRAPQAAAASWGAWDRGLSFAVYSDLRVTLENAITARRRQHDDIVLIDTDPSIGGAFADIPAVADLILLPVPPKPLEIKAVNTAYNTLRERHKRVRSVYGVRTMIVPRRRVTRLGLDALEDLHIPCLKAQIMERAIYVMSCTNGETVFSYDANANEKPALLAAQLEITEVGKEILKLLKIKSKR